MRPVFYIRPLQLLVFRGTASVLFLLLGGFVWMPHRQRCRSSFGAGRSVGSTFRQSRHLVTFWGWGPKVGGAGQAHQVCPPSTPQPVGEWARRRPACRGPFGRVVRIRAGNETSCPASLSLSQRPPRNGEPDSMLTGTLASLCVSTSCWRFPRTW